MGQQTKNKKLAILIPVFNGLDYTKNCLRNLKTVLKDHEEKDQVSLIISDDNSKDGTSGWVKEHYPEVVVLKGDGNLWWSGGINLASRYAIEELNTDFILWWNNDIEAGERYFSRIFYHMQHSDNHTLVGSKIFAVGSDIIWGMGGVFNTRTGKRKNFAEKERDGKEFQKVVEVDWFPGMGTLIPARVYNTIGYLDERNFPQYHGDSDFTFRAKKAGFRLIADPEMVIYNDVSNTGLIHNGSIRLLYKSLTDIKSNFNMKKDFLFYRKHSESILAFSELVRKYFKYTGGFFKWKVLGVFGVRKQKA
ncbi:MAG: glycosyltransferase family 2 protein [Bacteroidota bacterium]